MAASTQPFALIVEDDPFILMDACQIVEDAGFRCLEAKTGDEGRQVLNARGDAITLLITDVEMPGRTNGFELARYAADRWPEIAIVVTSGRVKPQQGEMPDGASLLASRSAHSWFMTTCGRFYRTARNLSLLSGWSEAARR